MPQLEFVDTFISALNGLVEAPDPFDDLKPVLDPFREAASLRRERSLRGSGETEPAEIEAPEDFAPERWMAQFENGRIPLDKMVQVMPGHYLRPDVAAAFAAMVRAAAADGVRITLTDSYRDYGTQVRVYREKGDYDTGGLAADPGTSPHGWGIAFDAGEGAQRDWLAEHGAEFGFETIPREPWHWQYSGGAPQVLPATEAVEPVTVPFEGDRSAILLLEDLAEGPPPFGAVLASVLAGAQTDEPSSRRGKGSSVKAQLYRGFMDAGRPDLAKMVYTKDFETWVGAESGWRVDVVSQYFPGHGRNYGLFQFWQGHPWTARFLEGGQWVADAYTQARLVARYFPHLTPGRIRSYAEQVRAGTYSGWG